MKSIKVLLGLAALVAIFTFSCKKSDSNDSESITVTQIVGSYTWYNSSSGTEPATITKVTETSVLIKILESGAIDLQLNGTVMDGKLTIPSQVYDGDTFTGSASLSGNVLTLTLKGSNSSDSWNEKIVLTKV